MNRRDFLVQTSLLAAASLAVRPLIAAEKKSATGGSRPPGPGAAVPEFKPLRRDTGIFTARGGTIGWLVSRDALAAIDTQFPDTAAMFLKGLPGRDGRKIDVVINTHHHADHTSGNGTFKPETRMIVAHENVPRLQRQAAERAGNVDRQVYADTTFAESWRRELGSEVASARYFGPAHTGGDIVTLLEKANVVHMGDLVFNRMYPVIDRPGGASIRGWITVLERVAKTYPADAIYIFGHGNPKFGVTGKRADLLVLRDYFSALLAYTRKRIRAGDSREKIITLDNLAGFPDFHVAPGPQNRLPSNLGVAYDELTEKKA